MVMVSALRYRNFKSAAALNENGFGREAVEGKSYLQNQESGGGGGGGGRGVGGHK